MKPPRKDRIFKGMEIIEDVLDGKAKRVESPSMIRWIKGLFKLVREEMIGEPEKEDDTFEKAVTVFGGNNDQEA